MNNIDITKYKQLIAENEELKKGVMLKCPQCGEVYLNRVGCELYEENQKYEQCIHEIENVLKEYNPLFTNPPLYMIDKIIKKAKGKGN